MSSDDSPPRCTPPMPPVAKTPMPARCAAIIVADTVVPPQPGRASTPARFWRETLGMSRASASSSSSSSLRPTRMRPSCVATVAGTAPASRTAASELRAAARLSGRGRPCVVMVDSSATTAAPSVEGTLDLGMDEQQSFAVTVKRSPAGAPGGWSRSHRL